MHPFVNVNNEHRDPPPVDPAADGGRDAAPPSGRQSAAAAGRRRGRRFGRFPAVEVIAVLVILILLLACLVKGTGLKTRLVRMIVPAYKSHPTVIAVRPGNFESGVALDAFVAVDV